MVDKGAGDKYFLQEQMHTVVTSKTLRDNLVKKREVYRIANDFFNLKG